MRAFLRGFMTSNPKVSLRFPERNDVRKIFPHVVTREKPWQRDFNDVQRQELHKQRLILSRPESRLSRATRYPTYPQPKDSTQAIRAFVGN